MGLRPRQTLTIASGGTSSATFAVPDDKTLLAKIQAPATLPETVTLRSLVTGSTYTVVQDGGFDVTIAAGKCVQTILGGGTYQLTASGAVAADRAFALDLYDLT